jgi:hypothetical protein
MVIIRAWYRRVGLLVGIGGEHYHPVQRAKQ